jgi:glyoxylase-like metal-dependent hydrolase (beta-lactamase superfamily II)
MELTEQITLLGIKDGGHTVYPVLLEDRQTGRLALVDAGWPGQFPLFEAAIRREGFSLSDIDVIILTHQDCDHVACVPELRAAIPGVRVACYEGEAPYIDGRKLPCKVAALEARFDSMTPAEREDFYPYRKRYMDSRTAIDQTFGEGIVFPHAGGVRVIHTPGHTPGHVSLLAQGVLIAGDAMNVTGGVLTGPKPDKSEDMALAAESLAKLAGYEFSMIACYHGGAVKRPGTGLERLLT